MLRPEDARAGARRLRRHTRGGGPGGRAAAGARPGSSRRRSSAGSGPATAELIEESDGRLQVGDVVGLSGLQLRYDEQLTGTPGVAGRGGRPRTATSAPLFTARPGRRRARSRPRLDHAAAAPRPSRCSPSDRGRARRRWWRSGRRPARCSPPRTAPAPDGLNIATYGQYAPGLDVQGRLLAGPAAGGLSTPATPSAARRASWSTARSSRTTTTTPPTASATSRCARRSPTPATPPSSAPAPGSSDGDLADAAESLGLGRDHDLGFPAYFGQVPPPESETEAGRRHDRPGQGPRLTAGDGHGRGVGAVRPDRRPAPARGRSSPKPTPEVPLTARRGGPARRPDAGGRGRGVRELPRRPARRRRREDRHRGVRGARCRTGRSRPTPG